MHTTAYGSGGVACPSLLLPTHASAGAPGLGPISVRKDIVVFKEGFRSRQYCLSECAQVGGREQDMELRAGRDQWEFGGGMHSRAACLGAQEAWS